MSKPQKESLEIIAKRYGHGRTFYHKVVGATNEGINDLNSKLAVFKSMIYFSPEETHRMMGLAMTILKEKAEAYIKELDTEKDKGAD